MKGRTLAGAALGAVALTGVAAVAPKADAAVLVGSVHVSTRSVTPSWVIASSLSIPSYALAVKILPGQTKGARHFISGWPCYSYWGYRYAAGQWHTLTTTNTLTLTCKNS